MADSQAPKPVAPAEAIPQAPAAALDAITNKEPGVLDKAKEMAMPVGSALTAPLSFTNPVPRTG